jgi:hypothetical protein
MFDSFTNAQYELIDREQRHQYYVPPNQMEHFLRLLDTNKEISEKVRFFGLFHQLSSVTPPPPGGPGITKTAENVAEGTSFLYSMLCTTEISPLERVVQNNLLPLPQETHDLIERCHNTHVGHGGVDRTLQLLQQLRESDPSTQSLFDSWQFQRADVRRFVKSCPICQKIKQHQLLKYTPHFSTSTYGIFDNISIDTIYMPTSSRGNEYLLVIIDSFSRYLDVYPIADLSAKTAMICLITYMSNFGIPSHLCCDNGSQFQGHFQGLLDLLKVDGYRIHPYSHQENSMVERANKEILTSLRALVLERRLKDDWDILCHVAKRIINSRIHSAIGIAPADLVFAGRIDLQRGSLFPYPTPESFFRDDYMHTLMQHQEAMLAKAVKLQQQHDMSRLKDKSHMLKTVFPIQSYVLVKPEKEPENKLAPRWLGPYLIIERFQRTEGDVYRCLHLSTNKEFDFRVDRLDPYYTYDESSLHDTAMLDDESYEVESVLNHRFTGKHAAANLHLQIKWLGYDSPEWQPYSGNGLNAVGVVHDYLRQHQLSRFIPSKYK